MLQEVDDLTACIEVKNLKNELASRIERQADVYRDHLSSIDKEIAKRLGK